jgi:PmbA protein
MFDRIDEAFEVEGYDQLEVYAEEQETIECTVANNTVDSVETEEAQGVGVRALVDNKVGFSFTTDPDRVKDAANRAINLARLSQFKMMSFPVKDDFKDAKGVFDTAVEKTTEEELADEVGRAIDRDVLFSGGEASRVVGTSYLKNSSGIEISQRGSYFAAYFTANRDNRSKFWFDASRSRFDASQVASKAQDVLERSMETVRVKEDKRTVVLMPYAQYQILSGLLYPAINADRVQREKSPLAGRHGERVMSETLTLEDDGLVEGGINTRPFDREGVPSGTTTVVADGTLENYLYDVQRAEKEGVESTGNATGGYRNMPSIQPRNMIVDAERGEKEELDEAVIIYDLSGVHTANETSGDYSLNITTGFQLEDGVEKAINGGMLVGNLFDLLENHVFSYGDSRRVDSLASRPAVFEEQKVVRQ